MLHLSHEGKNPNPKDPKSKSATDHRNDISTNAYVTHFAQYQTLNTLTQANGNG